MRYLHHHLSPSRWLWYYILTHYYCTGIFSLTVPRNEFVKTVIKNGSDIFGWINPKGMVFKSTGQHLELFCTINSSTVEATNCTSSNLKFYEDGHLLDSHNLTRVNETTIKLHLLNRHRSNHSYACFLNGNETKASILALTDIRIGGDEKTDLSHPANNQDYGIPLISKDVDKFQILVGSTRVVVGEKPQDVVNFRCHSIAKNPYDILCSWENPEDPAIVKSTVYEVIVDSEIKKGLARNHFTFQKRISEIYYSLTHRTLFSNHYSYNFTIIRKNHFGENQQIFTYDQLRHFTPEIQDSFLAGRMPTTITLQFYLILNYVAQHPLDLVFDICFRNYHKPIVTWNCSNYSEKMQGPILATRSLHKVTKLTPNTLYEFRTRCKSSDAPPYEEYWSNYANKTFKTATLLPEEEIGQYRIFHLSNESHRMVDIFWMPQGFFHPTKKYLSLSIHVFEVDEKGGKKFITNRKIPESHDVFEYIIGPSAYYFVRQVETSDGDNMYLPNGINVPALNNEIKFCPFFYVVQYSNNTYEYIWQRPEEELGIVNYTLFWQNQYGKPFFSRWEMNWTYLLLNQSTIPFNFGPSMTNDSIYYENEWNFYIRGNTKNFHSSLQKSVELISSVSDFWEREIFLQLAEQKLNMTTMERKAERHSKRPMNIGRKFSENQFHGWMIKLHGVEEPEACKGPKHVIRVREHY